MENEPSQSKHMSPCTRATQPKILVLSMTVLVGRTHTLSGKKWAASSETPSQVSQQDPITKAHNNLLMGKPTSCLCNTCQSHQQLERHITFAEQGSLSVADAVLETDRDKCLYTCLSILKYRSEVDSAPLHSTKCKDPRSLPGATVGRSWEAW